MATKAFLQKAYLAYFGRPVDYSGAIDYANSTEAAVMASFSTSPESVALYGSSFGTTQINAIYNMLFGRDAEPAGLDYWYNQVSTGKLAPAAAAVAILDGAKNADATAVTNKLAASAAFTTALDTTAEIVGYAGNSAAASARSFLKTVTATAATDAAVTAAVVSSTTATSTTGQSFTLTPGVDTFDGTSGPDFIRGVAGTQNGVQDQTTLNSSDVLNGGAGEDTLALLLTGGNYGGGATLRNIETLQIGTNDQVVNGRTFDYNVNAGGYEVTGVNKVVYDQITTGETLNVVNITPSATGNTIPTLHWANESGSAAGTAGATYRQASIAGTADNQNVILENVSAGVLNIARGIETLTVTSSGTVAANTLNTSDGADGTAADLVSETLLGNGVANDSTLTKVVVKGAVTFGKVATVNVNDNALEGGFGLTNRAANGGNDTGNSANLASASNLVSVNSTVTEIDATDAAGGVAMRFTTRANDGNAVNVTFKGSAAADYIEFARGNVTATGGAGDDTFAFVNGALTNFDFGSADSLVGGAGVDTIQLGVNGVGTVVANTTEFNNKSGIDVLDLRGMTNTVTLADTFVAAADAGTFVVRTDKIYQTSATSTANGAPSNATATANIALEDAAISTVVLTELADNRAIEFIGGSGSDRLVVDNASANANTKLAGGTNAGVGSADSLTVVNTAVLDAADVANISGFELLNLVETALGNNTFNVTLSEAFLLANSATGTPLTIASVTGTYGQALGAGDVVNLEISDLLSAGAAKTSITGRTINVQDLISKGVTVNFQINGVNNGAANVAPAALTTNVVTATAPTAALLNNVAGAGAGGGAVVPVATNVAVAEGANVIGAAASENFQLTNTTNIAAGTTLNGAGGTNSLQLLVATAGNNFAVGSAAAVAGVISITNIDSLTLANGGTTGVVTINDANARLANITGGTGNDLVTVTAMASGGVIDLGTGSDTLTLNATLTGAQTLAGGDGIDTLVLGGVQNLSLKTVSGFENLNISGVNAATTMSIAQYNSFTGGITANGADTITFTDGGTVTVNASNSLVNGYTFGAATTFSVLNASATNVTVVGSAGVDSINYGTSTGTTNTTGGAGADTITLNAANAAIDTVVLNSGATADSVTGFGVANDVLSLSLAGLNATIPTGALVAGTAGAPAALTAGAVTLQGVAGAAVVANGSKAFELTGVTFATSALMEAAIETAGVRALAFGAATTAGQDIIVAWYDTTGNAHVGTYNIGTAATTLDASGTYTELATLVGVAADTLAAVNFTIAA